MHRIEYRVRPVTRYIVTRFESEDFPQGGASVGSSVIGEYDNQATAVEVGYACGKTEHDRLGWTPDDERIQYPSPHVPQSVAVG